MGLGTWVAGPEIIENLIEIYPQLSTEMQAILSKDGLSLCGSLFAVPIGLLFLWHMASRTGRPAREYLALKWPGLRQGLGWGLLILAVDYGYIFLADWLDLPFGGDSSYEEIARFPLFLPLLVLSLAVLTPIFEELFFRGFLLEGLRQSRLGEAGAILMTSSLWAVMHSGGPFRWLGLILFGTLLARARLRTGSTYLPVVIHAISNLVAVIVMASQ